MPATDFDNKKRRKWFWPALLLVLLTCLAVFSLNPSRHNGIPLTAEERAWLKAHPVIRFASDPDFPPTEYFDKNGNYNGIAADYLALIEKNLGIRFSIIRLRNWAEVIAYAKSKRIDVFNAAETPERSQYALFTNPYIELPAAIIAREKVKDPLTMDKLEGMKVSVVSGYAAQEFIARQYPALHLDLVPNVQTGLRKVSFGTSDAFIENIATASYYIERDKISNLRIVGESGYAYNMAFGSRKDWPLLNRILQKGLTGISAAEKKAIYNKWIPLEPKSIFASKGFRTAILVSCCAIFLLISVIIIWNRVLRKQVRARTAELEKELGERNRIEEELRESEEKFRVLAETSPAGICLYQGERFLHVNAAAARMFGYSEAQCQGMYFWDWVHDNDKETVRNRGLARQRGEPVASQYEVRCTTRSGEEKWILVSAGTVEYRGTPAGIVTMFDITGRKLAEQLLRESEEKFRVLLETSPTAICMFQGEHIVYANQAMTRLTGYSEQECRMMKFWDWIHEDYQEIVKERGFAAQRGEQIQERFELQYITRDGEVNWLFLSGGRIVYRGKPAGIVSLFDITDRKRMEQELRDAHDELEKRVERRTTELAVIVNALEESEGVLRKLATELDEKRAFLRTLIDSVPDLIFYKDVNSVYLGCNKAFEALTGRSERDLIGRTDLDIFPRDMAEAFREMDREMLSSGSGHRHEDWIKYPDGRSILLDTFKIPYRRQDGTIQGLIGVGRDITERKIAEDRLQRKKQQLEELNSTLEKRVQQEVANNREKDILLIQQNRQAALGETLDHIAHQWKQPLNALSLLTGSLQEDASSGRLTDEGLHETTGTILDLVEHMAQTINVFRDFYRPEKKRTIFSIKDAIEKALLFIEPALKFDAVQVEFHAPSHLSALGYQKEYAQVLLNILSNAREAFRERKTQKPELRIKAYAENGKAVVCITDNAGGIPAENIDKIFDIYFTTRQHCGGSGIGLYLSKNIIEKNMGGTLRVENVACGAQFRIELDMLENSVSAPDS